MLDGSLLRISSNNSQLQGDTALFRSALINISSSNSAVVDVVFFCEKALFLSLLLLELNRLLLLLSLSLLFCKKGKQTAEVNISSKLVLLRT